MKRLPVMLALLACSVAWAANGGYRVDGTVKSVDDDDLKIERAGMPDIELDVRRDTTIKRDGQQVQLEQLKEGDEIRAQFEVYGDNPVALELDAKSKK